MPAPFGPINPISSPSAIEKEMTIVLPSHDGEVTYSDIDLTQVGQIKLQMAVAPTYFSGGKLEVWVDDGANGQKIGEGELEVGLTDLGFTDMLVDIKPTEGIHNLIIKVKCKDTSKIFGGLSTLEFIKRK